MKKKIVLSILLVLIIGGSVYFFVTRKENGICFKDTDCIYMQRASGCYIRENIVKTYKQAQKYGIQIGEAMGPENMDCTCQNFSCKAK